MLSWKSWGACGIAPLTVRLLRAPRPVFLYVSFRSLVRAVFGPRITFDAQALTDEIRPSSQPSRVLKRVRVGDAENRESQRYHRAVWAQAISNAQQHKALAGGFAPRFYGGMEKRPGGCVQKKTKGASMSDRRTSIHDDGLRWLCWGLEHGWRRDGTPPPPFPLDDDGRHGARRDGHGSRTRARVCVCVRVCPPVCPNSTFRNWQPAVGRLCYPFSRLISSDEGFASR